MGREVGSIWCLVLLIPGLLPGCWSQGSHTVVLHGYRHNSTLTSGDSVPLGTQIILVCGVVGLPAYGTPLSYTWTCPNEPCDTKSYYGRKVYNEHILAVNTTSTSDGGTYTCQVTATGGQEAIGNFTLSVIGGQVIHSYGRLIPHEFPITDLQQISGPDGIGRITCTDNTDSTEIVRFVANSGDLYTGGVSETRNEATATLVVNSSNVASFQNKGLYCTNIGTNFFYLFISSANPLSVPSLTVDRVTNSAVEYQVQRTDAITKAVITGYEVIRFGVPMIGQYVNTGRGRRVTINPAVPGAQYRITAWAFSDNRRSATPAKYPATGEANTPSMPVPTSTGPSSTAVTGSPSGQPPAPPGIADDTRTGTSAQPESSRAPDAQVTGFPPPPEQPNASGLIAGVVVAILVVVLLALVGGMVAVVVVVVKKRKMKKPGQSHSQAYLQDSEQAGDGHKEKINMYQNVQMKPTPTPGSSEPYYSSVADKFVNPASATASFGANTYDYSNVDHRALDGDKGGLYEDAGVDASRGGGGCKNKPVKGASEAQTASALLAKKGYELMHPEDFYAQPDKMAKVKKDNQGSKIEETPAPVEDLYTIPDMTKKMKQKNQKGLEQESEERKLPPQAPLPYKKHKEAKEEGEEDVPELPPPYDFDGEQDCDTGDGDGSERRFEYAVLDWQKK